MESRSFTCSNCSFGYSFANELHIDERLGLIRARILGGNSAKGDFIVFLDAHCRVSPRWLETPYKLLMEVKVMKNPLFIE